MSIMSLVILRCSYSIVSAEEKEKEEEMGMEEEQVDVDRSAKDIKEKDLKGIVPYTNDISTDVSIPKDVYVIPELKLALDNNGEDSMNTILQVKIALAYEKENQSVLNEIINRKEQIRDRVQYVIAKKSYQEISTAESREQTLKKDLLYELRNIMNGEILDIYYDTFVISRIPR